MTWKICTYIQGVPLATEPGISLIILPLVRMLQRNFKCIVCELTHTLTLTNNNRIV